MDETDNIGENYASNYDVEEKEDFNENYFCTLAVTGTEQTFQAIFLCNECNADDSPGSSNEIGNFMVVGSVEAQQQSPLCVCQACAEVCHNDGYQDVEYIGMGPSYCDCSRLGKCKLYEKSLKEAERLGIVLLDGQKHKQQQEAASSLLSSPEDFIRESFDISILQHNKDESTRSSLATFLVEQAKELIAQTKETHWVDETVAMANQDGEDDISKQKKLCLLESLAWNIYRSHLKRYKNQFFETDCSDDSASRGGAEWWVQVKNISTGSNQVNDSVVDENDTFDNDSNNGDATQCLASSSIDLHYDKDEALAESFGIGSFPALSTVTYLTASPTTAAPTVVFDHTYTQGEDEVMSSMMVSRPRIGKHICFDGRLLHGAPYHPSLLSSSTLPHMHDGAVPQNNQNPRDPIEPSTEPQFRVTFLVNIWMDRRPANVNVLDDRIRQSILSLPQPERLCEEGHQLLAQPCGELLMTPLTIPRISYEKEEDLPQTMQERIKLPFVSNLGEEEDDDEENHNSGVGVTVVVTFPPPTFEDSVLVKFGPGLQAYIDYSYTQDEDEYDERSEAANGNDEVSNSLIPKSESEYL